MTKNRLTALTLISLGLLAACSGIDAAAEFQKTLSAEQVDVDAGFGLEGPWGDAFKSAMDRTQSEKARAVLSDGIITAAERYELQEDFRECARAFEFKEVTFYPGNRQEFAYTEEFNQEPFEVARARADEHEKLCGDQTGVFIIEALYPQVVANPENTDTSEAIVACFREEGIIADDYTVEDYKRDAPTESFPLILIDDPIILEDEIGTQVIYDADSLAHTCQEDPYGYLGLRHYDWLAQ